MNFTKLVDNFGGELPRVVSLGSESLSPQIFLEVLAQVGQSYPEAQLIDLPVDAILGYETELEAKSAWIKVLSESLKLNDCERLSELNKAVSSKFIFCVNATTIDHISIEKSKCQQVSLRTLAHLPQHLRDLKPLNIGMLVFLNRSAVEASMPHNFAQFASLYRTYERG